MCHCASCTQHFREERKSKKVNGLKLVAEEEEEETAPEKRLRLAKEYIAQVEEEGKAGSLLSLPLPLADFLVFVYLCYCRVE